MSGEKTLLFNAGVERLEKFAKLNSLPMTKVKVVEKTNFGMCAYYRKDNLTISVSQCAYKAGAKRGRNWNWPGSTTDRTPYGVLAHEFGHHCDLLAGTSRGKYWSNYSEDLYKKSKEKAITSYAPDPSEWFAEIFRLFITNPTLLRELRPKTYSLIEKTFKPVEPDRDWVEVLDSLYLSPDYIEENLRKKVKECTAKNVKERRESGIKA